MPLKTHTKSGCLSRRIVWARAYLIKNGGDKMRLPDKMFNITNQNKDETLIELRDAFIRQALCPGRILSEMPIHAPCDLCKVDENFNAEKIEITKKCWEKFFEELFSVDI